MKPSGVADWVINDAINHKFLQKTDIISTVAGQPFSQASQ